MNVSASNLTSCANYCIRNYPDCQSFSFWEKKCLLFNKTLSKKDLEVSQFSHYNLKTTESQTQKLVNFKDILIFP